MYLFGKGQMKFEELPSNPKKEKWRVAFMKKIHTFYRNKRTGDLMFDDKLDLGIQEAIKAGFRKWAKRKKLKNDSKS